MWPLAWGIKIEESDEEKYHPISVDTGTGNGFVKCGLGRTNMASDTRLSQQQSGCESHLPRSIPRAEVGKRKLCFRHTSLGISFSFRALKN